MVVNFSRRRREDIRPSLGLCRPTYTLYLRSVAMILELVVLLPSVRMSRTEEPSNHPGLAKVKWQTLPLRDLC